MFADVTIHAQHHGFPRRQSTGRSFITPTTEEMFMTRVIPRTLAACALALLPRSRRRSKRRPSRGASHDAQTTTTSGVSVAIEALRLGGHTDSAGRYSFSVPAENARGQTVTLTARRLGYRLERCRWR